MNFLFSYSARIARPLKTSRMRARQSFRAGVSVGLVLAVFLTTLSLTVSVSAKGGVQPPGAEREFFVIYRGEGGVVCRAATLAERENLKKVVPKNLRQLNHLETATKTDGAFAMAATTTSDNDTQQHLKIILRGTKHLDDNPAAKAAFLRAATAWENLISSPLTIYIDADYGTDNFGEAWPDNVLGSTSSAAPVVQSYTNVRNSLIASANTPEKSAIYNALPAAGVPIDVSPGTATSMSISRQIARAIGLISPTADPGESAPQIGFNSTVTPYDFDASDGIDGDKTDFEAVATHEIGHALGFVSRSGFPTASASVLAMWDLYRFRSGTTDATFTNATRIMTVGGPTPNSQYYFTPGKSELGLSDGGPDHLKTNNADGNQSSHWRIRSRNGFVLIGIMDPQIPDGERRVIMPNDIAAINVFGYNSNIPPPPPPPPAPANDDFANAQTITGCSGVATGTNVNATMETGEPNHSPDNGGGSRSIWYQWQAPSTGTATITTAGSDFDTVLGVYTGSTVATAVHVTPDPGKDDDGGPDKTSVVNFDATAGVVYHIAVGGYNNSNSGGDVGNVTLHWSETNCVDTWSPVVLTSSQVELKSWQNEGRTFVYAKLTFPTAGYRVSNWGTPVRTGNAFSDDALVEQFNGPVAQVISTTAQIWDLGALAAGNYTFDFKNSGSLVKTLAFTVSSTPPPPNPIDDPREFVRWQYKDFLRREPDGPGWDHWTAEITMCSDPANRRPGESEALCVDRKRENTSAAFFLSPEFQNTGYFVLRVYRGSLGRMPHFGGTGTAADEFTRDAATVGQGIVVNNALDPNVINANKQAFVNEFVTRTEYRAIYDALSNTQYVDKLFQTTGVTPSASDRQALIDGLNGGTQTRPTVLFKVVDGTLTGDGGLLTFNTTYGKQFYDNLFNAAFVQMEYFGYLQRDPDPDGYAFWLGKLNTVGDWVNAQMVRAFITSPEYRARFGAP
jgi:uncharacterized protein DUF4214